MIGVHIQGRLGNQLFQYAFIFTASKKLKTNFFLDQSLERFILPNYFDIENYVFKSLDKEIFNIKGYKNLFYFYSRYFFYKKFSTLFNQKNVEQLSQPDEVFNSLENKTLYYGYFQSELYFKIYNEDIKCLFKVKNTFIEAYVVKYASLLEGKKIITIHIRRGDYQHLPQWNLGSDNLTLPSSYYMDVIKHYKKEENTLFIFVSDDIQFIENTFQHVTNKLISKDSEINDFLHLMLADVCIIANSSFSWWAAYLNQKENKVVHCPKYFLGFKLKKEYPSNIYPKDWIQHEVD